MLAVCAVGWMFSAGTKAWHCRCPGNTRDRSWRNICFAYRVRTTLKLSGISFWGFMLIFMAFCFFLCLTFSSLQPELLVTASYLLETGEISPLSSSLRKISQPPGTPSAVTPRLPSVPRPCRSHPGCPDHQTLLGSPSMDTACTACPVPKNRARDVPTAWVSVLCTDLLQVSLLMYFLLLDDQ